MRTMLLLMGAPGSGKSTFVKKYGLGMFSVSPNEIRSSFAPIIKREIDGKERRVLDSSFAYTRLAYEMAFAQTMLRADNGELIIVDANSIERKNQRSFTRIVSKLDYEVILVDIQQDVTLEELYERNRLRPTYEYVPKKIIERQFNAYHDTKQKLKIISPEEAHELIIKGKPVHRVLKKTLEPNVKRSEVFNAVLASALLDPKPSETLESDIMQRDLKKYLPELLKLKGVEQNEKWHPEGDVWTHTMLVVDGARMLADEYIDEEHQLEFMYGALLHDIGKHETTRKNANNFWSALHHEANGAVIAGAIMDRISIAGVNNSEVVKLVYNHMIGHNILINNNNTINKLIDYLGVDYLRTLIIFNAADGNLPGFTVEDMLNRENTLKKLERLKDR